MVGSVRAPSVEGFSTFVKLQKALDASLKRSWHSFRKILDWGSGCGRVTRYFDLYSGLSVTGVDIDSDNVAWCASAYPKFEFKVVPLHPPTSLADGSFDLLIGISIFTHLKEQEQFEWLDELGRVAAPGAILLMTVHGLATACRSGLTAEHFSAWLKNGFLDLGSNSNLAGAISESDYYRNTLHTHEYIRAHWGKYFEILDIIPGYIGNHQDLVIMRKGKE